MKHIIDSLMTALERLAKDEKLERPILGARVTIWRCFSEEVHANDKTSFSDEVRKRTLSKEGAAHTTREKAFWRDVAQFASNPELPKEWVANKPKA